MLVRICFPKVHIQCKSTGTFFTVWITLLVCAVLGFFSYFILGYIDTSLKSSALFTHMIRSGTKPLSVFTNRPMDHSFIWFICNTDTFRNETYTIHVDWSLLHGHSKCMSYIYYDIICVVWMKLECTMLSLSYPCRYITILIFKNDFLWPHGLVKCPSDVHC